MIEKINKFQVECDICHATAIFEIADKKSNAHWNLPENWSRECISNIKLHRYFDVEMWGDYIEHKDVDLCPACMAKLNEKS